MTAPYIIAEIASSHEGEPEFAKKLMRHAAGTGADAVKFQMFNRNALVCESHPKFEAFGIIEIDPVDWRSILTEAGTLELDVVVEPFDEASLALAEEAGTVARYKIPTSDIANTPFLQAVADTGKPIMLAVGGARDAEIIEAVGVLRARGAADITIMHGFQAYPTRIEDTNLKRLTHLQGLLGLPIGYADHVDASDWDLAITVPAMALAVGATVIEKHMTEDRGKKGRDHYSALEPAEFKRFAALIRSLAAATGSSEDTLNEAELTYRRQMKRQAVAARDLAEGAALAPADVVYKRTNMDGLASSDIDALAGRKLASAKPADAPISKEDLI